MSHKKTAHWTVASIQRVEHDGTLVTLHAGEHQAFDCHDLTERWPRAHKPRR